MPLVVRDLLALLDALAEAGQQLRGAAVYGREYAPKTRQTVYTIDEALTVWDGIARRVRGEG